MALLLSVQVQSKSLDELSGHAQHLCRRAYVLCERAEEMLRQVKTLQSDTKKAEARLRAIVRALEQTEENAGRPHRKLQALSA